ncbi:hypothetical protein EDB85DRAFT_1897889 [Lactarius pseudohatsudake]|nr:hypothetical protein EDB85DRAFT_1897889 [Lactarius pseudohatsudake]
MTGAFFGAVVLVVFSAVEDVSTNHASHKLCGLPTSAVRDPDHDNPDVATYDPNPNLASTTTPPPVPAFKMQVACNERCSHLRALRRPQIEPGHCTATKTTTAKSDHDDDSNRDHFKGEATAAVAITMMTQRPLQGDGYDHNGNDNDDGGGNLGGNDSNGGGAAAGTLGHY